MIDDAKRYWLYETYSDGTPIKQLWTQEQLSDQEFTEASQGQAYVRASDYDSLRFKLAEAEERLDYNSTRAKVQKFVSDWQKATFPHASIGSMFYHMKEEFEELDRALLGTDKSAVIEECSDIGMLLFGIAARVEFDLIEAIFGKLEVNKNREWGEPDERGVVKHIPTPESEE